MTWLQERKYFGLVLKAEFRNKRQRLCASALLYYLSNQLPKWFANCNDISCISKKQFEEQINMNHYYIWQHRQRFRQYQICLTNHVCLKHFKVLQQGTLPPIKLKWFQGWKINEVHLTGVVRVDASLIQVGCAAVKTIILVQRPNLLRKISQTIKHHGHLYLQGP